MNEKKLLIFICIFFLLTRVYKIWEIPPSVYWDEASIGYNAYSILKTGKDEWGEFLPLHFRAFGEFKLPVYIYSVVPFIQLFGFNEFSVRFPAVLFSLGVVILTYLLAKRLSNNWQVGLFAGFFVSISPWFFIFSRTGFEATAGLMFYLLGVYLFLSNVKNGVMVFLSVASFILSAYSYNSFRIIIPFMFFILILLERNNLKEVFRKQIRWVILSLTFIILSIWPIYRLFIYDVGFFRLQAVGAVDRTTFIKNYFPHFSLDFLLNGDKNLRHQQGGFGQVYFPDIALIILSFIYMLKSRVKYRWLPLILILIAPIPASLTRESPHALRAISAVPFVSILSAMGLVYIKKKIIEAVVLLIFLALFINYFVNFLTIYPDKSAKDWQYDYKQVFDYVNKKIFTDPNLGERGDKIYISDEGGQPYIFALFYLKYDPQNFRDEVVRNSVDKWGFSTVKSFGKFEFMGER